MPTTRHITSNFLYKLQEIVVNGGLEINDMVSSTELDILTVINCYILRKLLQDFTKNAFKKFSPQFTTINVEKLHHRSSKAYTT